MLGLLVGQDEGRPDGWEGLLEGSTVGKSAVVNRCSGEVNNTKTKTINRSSLEKVSKCTYLAIFDFGCQ